MKNEPVAWMQTWENQDGELKHTVNIEQIGKHDIPLYTHPVKEQEPTVPKNMQEWKGMDGATAYLLIDRHADNWADAKQMMEEWLEANSNLANPYQSITDTKIEPTVVSYTHPVNTCKHGVDDGACKECYQEVTHPAELTDEEIQQVWNKVLAEPPYNGTADRIGNFAKAILRKAQEK